MATFRQSYAQQGGWCVIQLDSRQRSPEASRSQYKLLIYIDLYLNDTVSAQLTDLIN